MKRYIFILIGSILFSCSGSDDDGPTPTPTNTAPSVPTKVYPDNGLLCSDNPLDFSWNASTDPDNDSVTYSVQVATNEQFSTDIQTKSSSQTNTTFTLEKGVAYYWRVRAIDSKNKNSDYSTIWKFYTEGEGISNYSPYTPTLISPTLNETIVNVTTILEWSSSDVDNDPLVYDVYFGETNPPTLVEENTSNTTYNVDLETTRTYYWKIVVKDDKGGQTIGQVWSFISQ